MHNGRDCAHGRQVGACDTCDLIDAEQRILELESALATARMENQEYELWIAAIAEDHSAVPDWIRQSARSMLAKGAK